MHLMDAKTIFIQKKSHATGSADFQPNTIASALARVFHRILAKRIDSAVEFNES